MKDICNIPGSTGSCINALWHKGHLRFFSLEPGIKGSSSTSEEEITYLQLWPRQNVGKVHFLCFP